MAVNFGKNKTETQLHLKLQHKSVLCALVQKSSYYYYSYYACSTASEAARGCPLNIMNDGA
jgi:hypothetical protein